MNEFNSAMPLTVEIKGVQFVNKGAELMLCAVLEQLDKIAPNCNVVLRPNNGSPYAKRAKLGAYQKLTLTRSVIDLNSLTYYLPKRLRTWMKNKWGVITEADVDVLLDASGFAYGDQWSSTTLRQLALQVNRFHRKNKPYVFLPQALGPFTREADRRRLQRSLPNASLIVAREKTSFENIKTLGVAEGIVVQYPDFTNLVGGVCPDYLDCSKPIFLVIPNSKMLSTKNSEATWRTSYIKVLSNAIQSAQAQGLRAMILNHEGAADQKICNSLQSTLSKPIELLCEEDPLKVKGIIGKCSLVLCSRFHGCVSALSQGVPCIGTSWSYKYERLFEDYNRRNFLVTKPIGKRRLDDLVQNACAANETDNAGRIMELKAASQDMWQQVIKRAFNDLRLAR